MIEAVVSISIAVLSGVGFYANRTRTLIHELDRCVDQFELRVAQTYVPRDELLLGYERIENRMIRIEEKLDQILLS